jgi:hypothetical protein
VNRDHREIDTSTPSSRRLLLRDTKVNITSQLRRILVARRTARHGNSSSIVLDIYTESTNEFRTVIDRNTNDILVNELSGSAHIPLVSHELFDAGVKSIDPFDQVKDGDIRLISYNSSVRAVCLLLPSTGAEGYPEGRRLLASLELLLLRSLSSSRSSGLRSLICCQLVY